jgi:ketosteroid isomerase-like protein
MATRKGEASYDEKEIRALYDRYTAALRSKNVDAIMAF